MPPGKYYYKHQHLYFADNQYPETSITFRGNGSTIISAGRDIPNSGVLSGYNEYAGYIDKAGNDYQNYSGMFQADMLVEILDVAAKKCRIHCKEIENAEIGKFCSIADHCRIGMSGHSLDYLSTSPIFTQRINALQEKWVEKDVFEHKSDEERVYIGNDVWIGSHVLINGGVHIGDGAVIGAGAVVVKNVPPYAIVGGVPAKLIRYRFSPEIIDGLLEVKWWSLPEEQIKNNIHLFQSDSIDLDTIESLKQEI